MEASMERMPIACVHCAKAKAKCDKKVPCSRCVTKQLLCQSRPTRRSSNMASRRANAPRARPESTHSSPPFNLSEFSRSDPDSTLGGGDCDLDVLSLMNRGCSFRMPQFVNYGSHRQSLPNLEYATPFGNGAGLHEPEPQLLHTGFSESPPEMSASITPVEQDYPRFDELMPMTDSWDQATYDHWLAMGGDPDLSTAFDMTNILEFVGPQQGSQMPTDFTESAPKVLPLSSGSLGPAKNPPSWEDLSGRPESPMDIEFSASSTPPLEDSMETDRSLASQESWPFFCCNRVPKSARFPPTTAARYVEGLTQVLTTREWHIPRNAHEGDAEIALNGLRQGDRLGHPIISNSAETLNAATEAILQKACSTHQTKPEPLGSGSDAPSKKANQGMIQLPPSEAICRLVEGYITHHKHYYPFVAGHAHSSVPILQSNVDASSLLTLLMVAQGAAFISHSTARYLASGLIEACRLFLFDSIEKDILLSREPSVLHSALLLTTAAAWSGDNWHMDIAMGQRGMYLSMLSHARMLDGKDQRPERDNHHQSPAKAWEEWKASEGRRRIAYSWVIVDQELSLFSDTAPLLNVVNLQAPMPGPEKLWEARSAKEWASVRSEASRDGLPEGLSLRDLFTSFVEGDLSGSESKLSPLELRLLLHPLQTLVCQLRQFLSCLPDSGRQTIGTSISKVAIKARLEEISTLLRQWYGFTERHIDSEGNTCWTTRANLIMYHLVSLNTGTSLGFIEQFARGEVQCASARQASQWLKTHCFDDAEQVYFHCGQILRHVQSIPEDLRPPWWAGAVYRAALIAWAISLAKTGPRAAVETTAEMDKPFAIDALGPQQTCIKQYLRYKEGVPMLSKRDGTLVSMTVPTNILQHCISVLEEDLSTRATEGITRKLKSLLERWRSPPFEAK